MWAIHKKVLRSAPVCAGILAIAAISAGTLAIACSGDDVPQVGAELYFPLVYGDRPTVAQLATLGRKIFFDPRLSASGKQACASCHDPAHGYGAPNALAIQAGGDRLQKHGFRNTPALTYVHSPISFTEHFLELEPTGSRDDEGPTGGRTWDGRVNSGHEQALMPLFDANEMANASSAELAQRLSRTEYAETFRQVVSAPGENVFENPDAAVAWLAVALEAFEQTPAEFHPFTSKFDAWLRDRGELTAQEQRGMQLFNDMKKGNCASCHPSTIKDSTRRPPIFTDFGFVALGVPRNHAIPANEDPAFFDLGLCGPLRHDLANKPQYCGSFRTPSLRNVALRKSYFHNGVFHSLREVVEFYATRETNPARWYAKDAQGQTLKYDDLPSRYQSNLNKEVPFAPLPGNRPRLNSQEIDDIVAFLETLSDGYRNETSVPVVRSP